MCGEGDSVLREILETLEKLERVNQLNTNRVVFVHLSCSLTLALQKVNCLGFPLFCGDSRKKKELSFFPVIPGAFSPTSLPLPVSSVLILKNLIFP